MKFSLKANYSPTGDQPNAINALVNGLEEGEKHQILLGVTGSGKTFTIANVIEKSQRPTLILAHNKTLAAQLYTEFKEFFPDNAIEYVVSYYDYYQPEAYLPSSNVYIEKDVAINEDLEKMGLSAVSSLLSKRRDVIVVSSVSCIYGMGNPKEFHQNTIELKKGDRISKTSFLERLVISLYSRNEKNFQRGNFRIKGDRIDVFLAHEDYALGVHFFGNEIELIESFDPQSGQHLSSYEEAYIYPANLFVSSPESLNKAIEHIQIDLGKQLAYFDNLGKHLESKRLKERTEFDIEMMKELGYCSGIENYSRYLDGRHPGMRPFCLIDYFPKDYLLVIDESHVTIPQVRGMYGGDRSRKENLVEFGFRLPAALDNRPLMFEEFEHLQNQVIYLSATPADYELNKSAGIVVEQLVRPTGLLDPIIEVRESLNQIDDLIGEVKNEVKQGNRVLVTTLTKRMAEELTRFLSRINIRCRYIHSDIDTIERVEIMQDLRIGRCDVLVGVNLLREGLDLPEVSLVIIIDADKEGFLRSYRSLTQTIGRAARNINGRAIMYADKITESMQRTINEATRRRNKQFLYNKEHNISPTPINKLIRSSGFQKEKNQENDIKKEIKVVGLKNQQKKINELEKAMQEAAAREDFIAAAHYRDALKKLKELGTS